MIHTLNKKFFEIAPLLIDKGADLTAENKDGRTPFQVALKHGYSIPEIIAEMFINARADMSTNEYSKMTEMLEIIINSKAKADKSKSNFLKKCSNVVLSLKKH